MEYFIEKHYIITDDTAFWIADTFSVFELTGGGQTTSVGGDVGAVFIIVIVLFSLVVFVKKKEKRG